MFILIHAIRRSKNQNKPRFTKHNVRGGLLGFAKAPFQWILVFFWTLVHLQKHKRFYVPGSSQRTSSLIAPPHPTLLPNSAARDLARRLVPPPPLPSQSSLKFRLLNVPKVHDQRRKFSNFRRSAAWNFMACLSTALKKIKYYIRPTRRNMKETLWGYQNVEKLIPCHDKCNHKFCLFLYTRRFLFFSYVNASLSKTTYFISRTS